MARFSQGDWLSGTQVDEGGKAAFIPKFQISQGDGGTNPATIYTAQQTVTASAVALTAQALVNGIVIKAKSTNSGTSYVGPAGVTTSTGYALAPGEAISFGVANASAVYVIGTASDVIYISGN